MGENCGSIGKQNIKTGSFFVILLIIIINLCPTKVIYCGKWCLDTQDYRFCTLMKSTMIQWIYGRVISLAANSKPTMHDASMIDSTYIFA